MADDAEDVAPDTAARIRETALELFTRHGYEKTSLREIAATLGITKAAVYYHYRSKVDILDDLLRPMADEEEQILADATESGLDDPANRLRLVERLVDMLLKYRALTMYVMNDVTGASNSRLVPQMQRQDRQLVAMLSHTDLPLREQVRTLSAIGAVLAVLTLPDVKTDELRPLVLEAARDVLDPRHARP